MSKFKTVQKSIDSKDIRITLNIGNYQNERLKDFTELPRDLLNADIEINFDNDSLILFGNVKKIEIEKEDFEAINE